MHPLGLAALLRRRGTVTLGNLFVLQRETSETTTRRRLCVPSQALQVRQREGIRADAPARFKTTGPAGTTSAVLTGAVGACLCVLARGWA